MAMRIAAVGAAVGADHHAGGGLFGCEAGTDREAAADALGDRHDIGRFAIQLMGEQFAGAGNAALHFVQNQQQAMLVGQGAQARQELHARRADAAFALDRLHHEGANTVVDGRFGSGEIIKRHHLDQSGSGSKPLRSFS